MKFSEQVELFVNTLEADGVDGVSIELIRKRWLPIIRQLETSQELGRPIAHIVRPGAHELAKLIDVHTTDPEKEALVAFCDYYTLLTAEEQNDES